MKNLLCILLLWGTAHAQVVIGGGVVGQPAPLPVVVAPNPASLPPPARQAVTLGMDVSQPVTAKDGFNAPLSVSRDTSKTTGGQRGYVNPTGVFVATAGIGNLSYEWTVLGIMNNYATGGENVAGYWQGNKYGTGPTWAGVSEVWSLTTDPGAMVAHEFDVWTTGPDTGNRIGLDVVLGDAGTTHGGNTPSAVVQGSSAIRIGAGLPAYRWTRGLQLTGNYVLGFDVSTANVQTALRLGYGQEISFEGTDQIKVKYSDGRIKFSNGKTPVFEIDMSTGDLYRMGKKVP